MEHCHLCAQAETYLGTAPLPPETAEEGARLATLDHTLRHHRVEIDELLLRLQQRDLDRRLATPGGTAIPSQGQAVAAGAGASMIRWRRRG
jgi:hypothetical protein